MTEKKQNPKRNIILRHVIISYPQVVDGKLDKRGKLKYSAAFLLDEQSYALVDGKRMSALVVAQEALHAAAVDKFGPDAVKNGVLKSTLTSALRGDPDDVKEKGYPAGVTFFNARSERKPGLVGIQPDANGRPQPLAEPEKELYAGARVNVSLQAYGYDTDGNRGVTFGLGNIQKVADGERLDGRRSATEEFDADLSQAVPDLDEVR